MGLRVGSLSIDRQLPHVPFSRVRNSRTCDSARVNLSYTGSRSTYLEASHGTRRIVGICTTPNADCPSTGQQAAARNKPHAEELSASTSAQTRAARLESVLRERKATGVPLGELLAVSNRGRYLVSKSSCDSFVSCTKQR